MSSIPLDVPGHPFGTIYEYFLGSFAIYGQERVAETIRLCKMNLAVHGLSGDIRQANAYYEDVFDCVGR